MNDIETIYTQYEDIVAEFSEQVIKNRYSSLYKECIVFLESLGIHDSVRIDETDPDRCSHGLFYRYLPHEGISPYRHIREPKVLAYETYWLLRRKPFQVMKTDGEEEFWAFLNEKFAFTRIASFLTRDQKSVILDEASEKSIPQLSGYPLLFSKIQRL